MKSNYETLLNNESEKRFRYSDTELYRHLFLNAVFSTVFREPVFYTATFKKIPFLTFRFSYTVFHILFFKIPFFIYRF
jgi:hypothetical protein